MKTVRTRKPVGIQSMIMTAFTALLIITTIVMALLFYARYEISMRNTEISNTQSLINSSIENSELSLSNIRQITNAVNYNIIQEYDTSDPEFNAELSLIYESNKEQLQSIALYNNEGLLLAAEPVQTVKEEVDVTKQEWFLAASEEIENMHFSTPHIQNLFRDGSNKYDWVVSCSTSVDINNGGIPEHGILLVDMKYSEIEDSMEMLNDTESGVYYFLCDANGQMIYHPDLAGVYRGQVEENAQKIAAYEDGTYDDLANGEKRKVVVSTIPYTGWKLVGVIPNSAEQLWAQNFVYYILAIVLILIMMNLIINRIIAARISSPILKLHESVQEYDGEKKPQIYIGGSTEIRHLGYAIQNSYEEIDRLMKEIVEQQTRRRKSEINALQSQINPHFLYNTLESVTWMIEGDRKEDAVLMITELGKLLRISLSKGRTIIKIEEELQHGRSYMSIQNIRYKKRFQTEFDIEEEVNQYAIVKLLIQPILENAIYYGVGDMDEDDGGKIIVRGRKEGDDIYISVEDNGMGMSKETARDILLDNEKVPKHGNGVGLINVHTRIQLMFGEQYGLLIESEPDEGTIVTIHIPAILYTEENREMLEKTKIGKEGK